MNDIYLGLDLATAGARLVAVADDGDVVAEASAALPAPSSPAPGHMQQDATYLHVSEALLRRVTETLGDSAGAIRAMCITGTSGTVVPCDGAGRPSGPAVLYNDQRATAEARRLEEAGYDAGATSLLARIGWLHARTRAARFLFTPDVVAAGLLGHVPPSDTSHALKGGIDPVTAQWHDPALAVLGLDRTTVPDLVHPGALLGQVTARAADRTGLPPTVRLYAGMTDGCTAQVGAGAVSPGDTVGVLGTTLVLKAVAETPVNGYGGAVYSHYAPDGRFWPGGASNVGAGLIRTEFPGEDLDRLGAAAERHGPADAVRYPLPGIGERFPFHRPDAEGFLVGRADTVTERYRTLLEGVAFTERLGLEALASLGVQTVTHRVVGGGSRSHAWNRIRATVLGAPVTRPGRASSGYGAALLAATAHTDSTLTDLTKLLMADAEVIEPDPLQGNRLHDSYERLREELRRRGYLPADARTEEAT